MEKFSSLCLRMRTGILLSIVLITLSLGYFASQIRVETIFSDLQPSNHPYTTVHEKFKTTFGGANVVSIMVEVKEGDIFQREVLNVVRELTNGLLYIDSVNQFQIISLATKKLKEITASTEGIVAEALMWPHLPETDDDIAALRQSVVANPMAYGTYVSRDLKAALVTVDFIDRLIDYKKVYPQILELVEKLEHPSVNIKVVGQPVLIGLVIDYLPETIKIMLLIIVAIAFILLLTKGTLRGMFLPLLSAAVSGLWALGIIQIMGINIDPLGIVITFLISARAISHAVQFNLAFDKEREHGELNAVEAARLTLKKLLRPGLLGLSTDAGAMLVVYLTPIPLLQKAALLGALWLGSMVICTIIMVPLLLSWTKAHHEHRIIDLGISRAMHSILVTCANIATHRQSAILLLSACVVILLISGFIAKNITIGDANPGSPILWSDSTYNRDDAAINKRFPGSDRMFVVVNGEKNDVLKQPEIMATLSYFQKYIEALPAVGGTTTIADIIRPVNMTLHEGNPRYYKVADDSVGNAEMIYIATANSDPGDIDRFTDYKSRNGSVLINFRDHKGDSIRKVIQATNDFKAANPMEGAEILLAGGMIGVLAAVNEVIFSGQLQSIALALLLLFVFCSIAYRSTQAGLFFLPTVVISNTITFSFMSLNGIGLNVNTLPVAALGIGLGVDYAFYIADRIKERFRQNSDLADSIQFALTSAGRGVIVTALTMVISVVLWYFFSSLRFQAEMGLLIALWMSVSAVSALLVIPSMIYLFRPRFLLSNKTGA